MQQRQEPASTIEQWLHTLQGHGVDVYLEEDRMTLVREEPEIVESTPPPSSSPSQSRSLVVESLLLLLVLLAGALVVAFSPQPGSEQAFAVTVPGFGLAPVHQSATVQAKATGKGFIAATIARGVLTFYNGQPYTQIIPLGTILTGHDGVQVITEEQASIPPVAQTLPPTDGTVTVSAHALAAGARGNIVAGDINQPCCVTSVIAQNPYPFRDGRDAQHFTYVSKQDVSGTAVPLLTKLEAQAPHLFASSLVLSPHCTPSLIATPAIGQKASLVRVTVTITCTALSYHPQDVQAGYSSASATVGVGNPHQCERASDRH